MFDVNFILLNKLLILGFVFIFFLIIRILISFFKNALSPSKVNATLKLCLVGIILLFFEVELSSIPYYGPTIKSIQGLIVIFCFANFINYLVVDIYLFFKTHKKVPSFLRDIISLAMFAFFAVASLRIIFKIEVASIITTSAVLTAAIAFAMQNTLSNIIAGFSIQLDKNLTRKSWISIKDKGIEGEIVNIGFRYTSLKTLENYIVVIPNSMLLQNILTNLGNPETKDRTALTVKIGLAYEMPPEKAKELLKQVIINYEHVLKTPQPQVYITNFSDSSIDYEMRFFIDSYALKDVIKDSILTQIWYFVLREGYDFPYPHRHIVTIPKKQPFNVNNDLVLQYLNNVQIFSVLNSDERSYLAQKANLRVYAPGEFVVTQGDTGNSLFIIISGSLKVMINNVSAGTLNPGDIFGEMSLLTGEKRSASVVAENEVWLVEINKEVFEPVIKKNDQLLDAFCIILAERQKSIELHKETQKTEQVSEVKEEFLLRLKKFFGI